MAAPKPSVGQKLSMGQKVVKSAQIANQAVNGTCSMNILVILTAFLFSAVIVMNYLAANTSKSYGLFQNSISNVSAMYPLTITPAGWTFSIWGVIYLLQLSWVLYSFGLLCRSTPSVLTASFFAFFNVTSVLNIAWLFLWDRLHFLAAFLVIFCLALSLYLTVATAARRIVQFRETLIDAGRKTEYCFLNIAVLNGVSMYATWVTVATSINLGIVLAYKLSEPLPIESVSVICLAFVAVCFVIYVALDFSVFQVYTRHSVTPYITVVWALAGILSKNWDSADLKMSSIVAAVMLGIFCMVTLLKVTVSVYKAYQYNLGRN